MVVSGNTLVHIHSISWDRQQQQQKQQQQNNGKSCWYAYLLKTKK